MQGARAAQISVENTSSTSDQRGSFVVPGPQSQTSFLSNHFAEHHSLLQT